MFKQASWSPLLVPMFRYISDHLKNMWAQTKGAVFQVVKHIWKCHNVHPTTQLGRFNSQWIVNSQFPEVHIALPQFQLYWSDIKNDPSSTAIWCANLKYGRKLNIASISFIAKQQLSKCNGPGERFLFLF